MNALWKSWNTAQNEDVITYADHIVVPASCQELGPIQWFVRHSPYSQSLIIQWETLSHRYKARACMSHVFSQNWPLTAKWCSENTNQILTPVDLNLSVLPWLCEEAGTLGNHQGLLSPAALPLEHAHGFKLLICTRSCLLYLLPSNASDLSPCGAFLISLLPTPRTPCAVTYSLLRANPLLTCTSAYLPVAGTTLSISFCL